MILRNYGDGPAVGDGWADISAGLKYKPSGHTEIGVAWEVPLTERRDVLENRITFDWIFRY